MNVVYVFHIIGTWKLMFSRCFWFFEKRRKTRMIPSSHNRFPICRKINPMKNESLLKQSNDLFYERLVSSLSSILEHVFHEAVCSWCRENYSWSRINSWKREIIIEWNWVWIMMIAMEWNCEKQMEAHWRRWSFEE